MKRAPKKRLVVFALVVFFNFGIWCATLAAPGLSLASVTGCTQNGPMQMTGCQHPSYLCGFDSSANLLSQGALSSARSNDLLKNAFSLVVGETPPDAGALLIGKECENAFAPKPHKVSIRLFNSVQNL